MFREWVPLPVNADPKPDPGEPKPVPQEPREPGPFPPTHDPSQPRPWDPPNPGWFASMDADSRVNEPLGAINVLAASSLREAAPVKPLRARITGNKLAGRRAA